MKKVVNFILSTLSLFAPFPTAWAIYAGVTEQPVFPMWEPAAIVGALAVIATTAAAGMLIVDILKHNQEAKDADEQTMNLPVWYGWAILAGCIAAEILLSLLIVVFAELLDYGVLAFPLLTMAGVFVVSVRMTLEERIQDRINTRAKHAQELAEEKEKHAQELAQLREQRRTARESKRTAAESAPIVLQSVAQSAASAPKYPRRCEHCPEGTPDSVAILQKSNSVGGHMKKHHPELCKKNITYAVPYEVKATAPGAGG